MKTLLILIALMPNGTERTFPIAEVYYGQMACEMMLPAAEESVRTHPVTSGYIALLGAEVRLECVTEAR